MFSACLGPSLGSVRARERERDRERARDRERERQREGDREGEGRREIRFRCMLYQKNLEEGFGTCGYIGTSIILRQQSPGVPFPVTLIRVAPLRVPLLGFLRHKRAVFAFD